MTKLDSNDESILGVWSNASQDQIAFHDNIGVLLKRGESLRGIHRGRRDENVLFVRVPRSPFPSAAIHVPPLGDTRSCAPALDRS